MTDPIFPQLDAEAFIVKRLKDHGAQIFQGVTDSAERRQRIRKAIIDAGLDRTIVGRNSAGKTETYSQTFERAFHEPLYLDGNP